MVSSSVLEVKLRDYQQSDICSVRAELASNNRVILVAPTGSGKTVTVSDIIRRAVAKDSRVTFLVHRRELVDQASTRLDDVGVEHGVIMRGHWRNKPNELVQVCSIQTLIRREAHQTDLFVIDECHRALGETYLKLISRSPGAKVIGLTATPIRADGKGLNHLFESIVESLTPAELTERGFLVPARVFGTPQTPDLKGVRKIAGDYDQKRLAQAVDKPTLVGDIIGHWKDIANGRQTVCFATSVEHSKHIVEQFLAAGIAAEHLDAHTPLGIRKEILERITNGETKIVSNVGVWTEGVDVPVMSCAILARPTASMALALQMMGRVLRPYAGKQDALILDHAGVVTTHGFPTDRRDWSLDGIRRRKADHTAIGVETCKNCYHAYLASLGKCPECGWEKPKPDPRKIVTVAGQLIEITPQRPIGKISHISDLAILQLAAAHFGYKPGWVYQQRVLGSGGRPPKLPDKITKWMDAQNIRLKGNLPTWNTPNR